MEKNNEKYLLYFLDVFSIYYLHSCAGLYVDERKLTITSHSGNTIFDLNNNFEKRRILSFEKSYQDSMGNDLSNDESIHGMPRIGDVSPLYPMPNDFGYEWCKDIVEQGMNRFYHMVVFALLLEAKQGTIQIQGVDTGNITDEQMNIFFAEKLPLLYQSISIVNLTVKFEFIHTSIDLIERFQKKYNKKFIYEVINVSKFLIGDEDFSLNGREISVQSEIQNEIVIAELHADTIIHYCRLAIFLQPYLLKQYGYDNKANMLKGFLKRIDKFVKKAMELGLRCEPAINNFYHSVPAITQGINYNYFFNFIYDMVNAEFENIQTSLYRFLKLSNNRLISVHTAKQLSISNQFQPQLSPYIAQSPVNLAQRDYLLDNDFQLQRQVYAANVPVRNFINSEFFLPDIAPIAPANKTQSQLKVWEIINELNHYGTNSFKLNRMPYKKNDEYDKMLLLLYRAEFELIKSVYDPEESHRLHLDFKIVVYDFIDNASSELSVKDFVNAGLPMKLVKAIGKQNNYIQLDINQTTQRLGLKVPLPLLFMYSHIHGGCLSQCAIEILQKANVTTDLDSLATCSPLRDKGDFSEASEPFVYLDGDIINFRGENSSTYYQVIRGVNTWGFSIFYTEMPLIYISKTGEQYHIPLLLPPKTHHLYGLDNLLKNRNIHTFLTEHLGIAHLCSDLSNAIFLSWWGGEYTLDVVDFSPLQGRTVYYVLFNQDTMRTALKACRRIKEINGKPSIVYCERSFQSENNVYSDLNVKETDIYNDEQFEALAERINYQGEMFEFTDKIISDDSNKTDLVKGIIKSNQFIVVYGKEKSGKTYVCLSLSLGIACKKNPHELWEINNEIDAGVMYCHGEMDDEDISGRIDFLKKKMGIKQTKINFESINLRDIKLNDEQKSAQLFNLTESECQEYLYKRVQKFRKKFKSINQMLIVLDNYASLMGTGSQQGDMFNPAYGLILKLQTDFQCCVILVCHDNMQGAIASSRQIVRKVDGVIKVSRVAEWKKEIRDSFFSKKKMKDSIDYETIREQLREEFITQKGVIVSHIAYENFRNIDNLEPFSMTLRFNEDFDNLYAWEIEKSDKEKYIDDLIQFHSGRNFKPSRRGVDSAENQNVRKVSFDALKTMTPDEICMVIGKVWSQIGPNTQPAKNGKVPILKAMANYFSVSEPTFRNLGKEKGFEKGFTAGTLEDIIKNHQPGIDTKAP